MWHYKQAGINQVTNKHYFWPIEKLLILNHLTNQSSYIRAYTSIAEILNRNCQ